MVDIDNLSDKDWLLVSGTLCTEETFSGYMQALGVPKSKQSYIEISHGDIAAYKDIISQRVTENTIVCGFSLGALLVAHFADDISPYAMILFGVNPRADTADKRGDRLEMERDVIDNGGRAALETRLPTLNGKHPERVREIILEMAEQSEHLMTAHTQLALTRPGASSHLAQSQYPIFAFTGDQDQITPYALAQEAVSAATHGKSATLEGLGHYALLEDPELCATITRFYFN